MLDRALRSGGLNLSQCCCTAGYLLRHGAVDNRKVNSSLLEHIAPGHDAADAPSAVRSHPRVLLKLPGIFRVGWVWIGIQYHGPAEWNTMVQQQHRLEHGVGIGRGVRALDPSVRRPQVGLPIWLCMR